MSLVCTRMPFICHSCVLVCYPYVTRISLVCHPHVTRMWFYHKPFKLKMETQNVAWSLDPLDYLCNKAFSFINLFLAEGTLINSGNVALANSYFNWQCLVSRCIKHFCNNNAFSFVNLF